MDTGGKEILVMHIDKVLGTERERVRERERVCVCGKEREREKRELKVGYK